MICSVSWSTFFPNIILFYKMYIISYLCSWARFSIPQFICHRILRQPFSSFRCLLCPYSLVVILNEILPYQFSKPCPRVNKISNRIFRALKCLSHNIRSSLSRMCVNCAPTGLQFPIHNSNAHTRDQYFAIIFPATRLLYTSIRA